MAGEDHEQQVSGASPESAAPPTAAPRRRRGGLAVLAAAVVLVLAGGVLWAAHATGAPTTDGSSQPLAATITPSPTTSSPPDPEEVRSAEIGALLRARAAALSHNDLKAWLATVDQTRPAVVARESGLFANLRALPLAQYSYRIDVMPTSGLPVPASMAPGVASDDVYSARFTLDYQLRGFDPVPVLREQALVFVRRGGHWRLAGDQTRTALPAEIVEPWDDTTVAVAHSADVVLVLSRTDKTRLPAVMATAEAALGRARAMWPKATNHKAVLYLTGDQDALRTYAGDMKVADFAGITVQVTNQLGGKGAEGTRVLTNPHYVTPTSARLLELLTHEFTHVVQWPDQSAGCPLWVIEGVAEYTAYRNNMYHQLVSETLFTEARKGRLPTSLPATRSFYSGGAAEGAHYSYSWLAWQYISRTYGETRLRALYDRMRVIAGPAGGADAVAAERLAFQQVLGTSEASFVGQLNAWAMTVLR